MIIDIVETSDELWPYMAQVKPTFEYGAAAHQIPAIKAAISAGLDATGTEYQYATGLRWYLKTREDATMFTLRFS